MELVYLWVEDYKNIKKQGFNFSPRFNCSYNEDTKEYTIDEKKDYVSVFPDNINITAIVGENGSGKSKLLNCFSSDKPNSCREFLYFKDNKLYRVSRKNCKKINIKNKTKYGLIEKEQNYQDVQFLAFNLSNELDDGFTRGDYIQYNNIDEKESKKELLKYLFVEKKDIHLNILPFYFHPDSLSISGSGSYLEDIYRYFNDSFSDFVKEELLDYYYNKGLFLDDDIVLVLFYIKEIIEKNKNKLSKENKDYYWDFIDKCKENLKIENTSIEDKIKEIKNYDSSLAMPKEDFLRIKPFLYKYYFHTIEKLKEENVFDLLLSEKYFSLFDIDLADKNKDRNFFILSSGEKYLYTFFIQVFKEVFESEEQDIIIMIDELENYLHPNWQKKIIDMLIVFLKKNFKNKKFQIVITSHSPFIISDLPKENVIFLKNGKQQYPFKDKQTFGANIHTLLSDGFFMSDGLMGEFAKGKIEEIKNFYDFIYKFESRIDLNKKVKKRVKQYYLNKKDKFHHIQSIIGEPFLQTVIKNYLDELEQIFDNENYKLKQKEKLLSQFTKEELQRYVDEQ